MPPRFSYWTIILEGKPTAFRAYQRDDLQTVFKQLQTKHPDVVMKWFARGRLWESPEEARAAEQRGHREKRQSDWRPGGEHRDPRARFEVTRAEKRRRFSARFRPGDDRDSTPPSKQHPRERAPVRRDGREPAKPEWKQRDTPAGNRPARPEWTQRDTPAGNRPARPEWTQRDRPAGNRPAKPEWKQRDRPATNRPAKPEWKQRDRPAGRPEKPEWKRGGTWKPSDRKGPGDGRGAVRRDERNRGGRKPGGGGGRGGGRGGGHSR